MIVVIWSASVLPFSSVLPSVSAGPRGQDSLPCPRRPHSVDLGRVSVLGGGRGQQYNFLKMKLSDDFRRAGIGACLEGEWDELCGVLVYLHYARRSMNV